MSNKAISVLLDERPIVAHVGYTIMQTCSNAGVDIPRFCYHDKLLIAGNCRICLVEVTGSKKLVASCAVHVTDNMSIFTNTVRVRLARQNVLEFLLANHPLDCPICDQGGECDLQDITSLFGADRGRFYENEKRAVLNKDFGPLIRTSMNRCIHCTRCVRFLAMSSGSMILGTLGRGSSTEIGSYVNTFISDELSGNITDLCPVGALTSKPYSFKARPWELTSVRGIDIFDSMCSSLLFDVMANKICRVLPYANETLNECWLTNKARYAYDGLFVQRLNSCLLKISLNFFTNGKVNLFSVKRHLSASFIKISWATGLQIYFKLLFDSRVTSYSLVLGNQTDLETAVGAQLFTSLVGGVLPSLNALPASNSRVSDWNFLYLFNTSLAKLTKLPSFCLLVGLNLRLESPLVNLRLGSLVNDRGVSVFKIGGSVNYSALKAKQISNKLLTFFQICEFKHPFCKNFYVPSFGYRPFILVSGFLLFQDNSYSVGYALMAFLTRLSKISMAGLLSNFLLPHNFCSFGFLHQYSSAIHLLSSGLVNSAFNGIGNTSTAQRKDKLIFYHSLNDLNGYNSYKNYNCFSVYQGSHGFGSAMTANLIFPTTVYVERSGFFQNLLGVVQKSEIVIKYDFSIKSDLEIFRALMSYAEAFFGKNFFAFSYNNGLMFNLALLMNNELALDLVSFFRNSFVAPSTIYYVLNYNRSVFGLSRLCVALDFSLRSKIFSNFLPSGVVNYYGDTTTSLLVASKTMSLCSNLNLKNNFSFSSVYY